MLSKAETLGPEQAEVNLQKSSFKLSTQMTQTCASKDPSQLGVSYDTYMTAARLFANHLSNTCKSTFSAVVVVLTLNSSHFLSVENSEKCLFPFVMITFFLRCQLLKKNS